MDNPDQRITSDVSQFCDSALELVFTFLRAAVDLVSFSGAKTARCLIVLLLAGLHMPARIPCFPFYPFWWWWESTHVPLILFSSALAVPLAPSGILFGIYPPLFIALAIYSVGGTGVSIYLGRPLVGLNFNQEAREADFR